MKTVLRVWEFVVRVCLVLFVLMAVTQLLAPAVLASNSPADSPPQPVTPEQLGAMVGVVLSLLFAYIPGFKTWYDKKSGEVRALVMLGLLVLVAVAIFALSCASPPILPLAVKCSQEGAWELVYVFIAALVANQGTFLVAVDPFKPKPTPVPQL